MKKFVRRTMMFLCLLIFSQTISAQETLVPIMSPYYLIGGSKNGKWLTAETIAAQIKEKTAMVTVDVKGIGKSAVVLENTGEEFGACPENTVMKMMPEIESGIAVGENAKWNLVPRLPQSIAVTDKIYTKIAADFLKTKGIVRPKINLSQVLQIDLEGDGQNEILITGNFYKNGRIQSQVAGDYSFALLRRIVKGKARNILIEGEFFTKRGDYEPPYDREIAAVADLNGDGKMEIVLHTTYYEGSWEQVLEISGGKLIKVLEVSCIL